MQLGQTQILRELVLRRPVRVTHIVQFQEATSEESMRFTGFRLDRLDLDLNHSYIVCEYLMY